MQKTDDRWKGLVDQVAGRRKGQLWRTNDEWFAIGGLEKGPKQLMAEMKQQVKSVRKLDSTMTNDGWTGNKMFKKQGSIPFYIMLAHPELWYDDAALAKFYKDNPKWAVGG
jgi:hypothetical protein